MRAAAAAISFAMVTACGTASDQYGGQWREGPWQQPRLVGCSAEVVVRAPTKLLGRLNEWLLEAPPNNNCPTGILTVEAPIADFLPRVSPGTRRELEALMALGRRRATEAARLVDEAHSDAVRERECRELKISVEPNHADPETGTLVARRMQPPEIGARYEMQDRPIYRYGLTGLGRETVRSVEVDRATGQKSETRHPMSLSAWKLDDPAGGAVSFRCHHPLYPHLGTCYALKDRSTAVKVRYSLCLPMLPDWRQVDRAVGMILDDWIASERLVKYVGR